METDLKEEFTIVEATVQSLDEFIPLLEDVAQWLWDKGVKQWAPGTFEENRARLEHAAENGCLILAYRGGALAGGCILSDVNPGWPNSDQAMYLSSLAVARFAAGRGLGEQIIDACAEAVRKRGKSLIRLDCWEGNSFLKTFYQGAGFRMLEAVQVVGYSVRPFERDVPFSGVGVHLECPASSAEPARPDDPCGHPIVRNGSGGDSRHEGG